MLEVKIYKDFGNFILDANFKSDDKVLGILGASGSGKSITLKCIAGIIKPDRGRIVLNNRVLFDSQKHINLKPQDRKIGFLFQDYALFPNMTVYENIKTGIRNKNVDIDSIINKKLEEMNLQNVKDNKPEEISGGEKQRTALARILVNDAELLLLDEPYSAIDGYLRWIIELEIKDTIEKYGIQTLFVSHDRDEVYRMCDSITIMKDGKSESIKKTKNLFENPVTLSAAELSGCKNFSILENIKNNEFYAKDWGIELTLKNYKPCDIVGMRSHYIKITDQKVEENVYPLEIVKEIEELFNYCIIAKSEDTKLNGNIRIDIEKDRWNELKKKEKLYFQIKEEDLLYLEK